MLQKPNSLSSHRQSRTNTLGFNNKPLKCPISVLHLHLTRDYPHCNKEDIVLFAVNRSDSCLFKSDSRYLYHALLRL